MPPRCPPLAPVVARPERGWSLAKNALSGLYRAHPPRMPPGRAVKPPGGPSPARTGRDRLRPDPVGVRGVCPLCAPPVRGASARQSGLSAGRPIGQRVRRGLGGRGGPEGRAAIVLFRGRRFYCCYHKHPAGRGLEAAGGVSGRGGSATDVVVGPVESFDHVP